MIIEKLEWSGDWRKKEEGKYKKRRFDFHGFLSFFYAFFFFFFFFFSKRVTWRTPWWFLRPNQARTVKLSTRWTLKSAGGFSSWLRLLILLHVNQLISLCFCAVWNTHGLWWCCRIPLFDSRVVQPCQLKQIVLVHVHPMPVKEIIKAPFAT